MISWDHSGLYFWLPNKRSSPIEFKRTLNLIPNSSNVLLWFNRISHRLDMAVLPRQTCDKLSKQYICILRSKRGKMTSSCFLFYKSTNKIDVPVSTHWQAYQRVFTLNIPVKNNSSSPRVLLSCFVQPITHFPQKTHCTVQIPTFPGSPPARKRCSLVTYTPKK